MKKLIAYIFLLVFCLFHSCEKLEILPHSNPLDDGRPFVSTLNIDVSNSISAIFFGEVTNNGSSEITQFGHCFATHNDPTIDDTCVILNDYDIPQFSTTINNLTPSTTYYVRSFATNSQGTGYGDVKSFTTFSSDVPIIQTSGYSMSSILSVTLEANVIDVGTSNITQHGHCWTNIDISSGVLPTIDGGDLSELGEGTVGEFSTFVNGLEQNMTYYFRAYVVYFNPADNSSGVVYGELMSFTTSSGEPVVITVSSENITATTVDLSGEIIFEGETPIIEYGHYLTTENSLSPDYLTSATVSSFLGPVVPGSYISSVLQLEPNTQYYYMAYAMNDVGVGYGEVKSFTTPSGLPQVITGTVNNLTPSSVNLEGQIISQGAGVLTAFGHQLSTSSLFENPETTFLDVEKSGAFISFFSISPNITYYYRAYAINEYGPGVGEIMTFTSSSGEPVVVTGSVEDVTYNSATLNGEILSVGQSSIFHYGHIWHKEQVWLDNFDFSIINPSTESDCYICSLCTNNYSALGLGEQGSFSTAELIDIDGDGVPETLCEHPVQNYMFETNTTYYYQAYAINEYGVGLGEIMTFTTSSGTPPEVSTGDVSDLTAISVTLDGSILSPGTGVIIEHGHCWSSSSENPTISSAEYNSYGSIESGSFEYMITDLLPNTNYYYRAYATNPSGTSYGEILSFSTPLATPTVTTGDVSLEPTDLFNFLLEGDILDGGVNNFFELNSTYNHTHGHIVGSSSLLSINDPGSIILEANGISPYDSSPYNFNSNFCVDITTNSINTCSSSPSSTFLAPGLFADQIFYYKAFAQNDYGVSYGTVSEFSIPPGTQYSTYTCESLAGVFSQSWWSPNGWTYYWWDIGYGQGVDGDDCFITAESGSFTEGTIEFEWLEDFPGYIEAWVYHPNQIAPTVSGTTAGSNVLVQVIDTSGGWIKIRTPFILPGYYEIQFNWTNQEVLNPIKFDELTIFQYY